MITLVLAFLKIGFLGFGGGYAMLSLIYAESATLGITRQQFIDLNAIDWLIPGPIAINSATYIGQLHGGFWEALAATLAVCVPSFVFIPLYLHFEKKIGDNWLLNGIVRGIKPASAGLILAVAITVALTAIGGIPDLAHWANLNMDWQALAVMVLVLALDLKWHVNPIWLLVIAGALGAAFYYVPTFF